MMISFDYNRNNYSGPLEYFQFECILVMNLNRVEEKTYFTLFSFCLIFVETKSSGLSKYITKQQINSLKKISIFSFRVHI